MQSVEEFRKNFDSVYYNKLLNIVEPFEKERKKNLAKVILCIITIIIIVPLIPQLYKYGDSFLMSHYTNLNFEDRTHLLIWLVAIPVAICVFLLIQIIETIKCFENSVKRTVMPLILKSLHTFAWTTQQSITSDFVIKAKLLGDFNMKGGDDNFTGRYKNVDIKMWEATLMKKSGVGSKKIIIPRFTGLLVALFPQKQYNGLTIIKKDKLINVISDGLQQVNLEDIEFEKEYNVYSNDQIEARYILTTAFMERFKNIKLAFRASKIEASISEQGILLAISTNRDLFKVGKLWRPVADYEQFKTMADEFASILELIDTLKLEQNIGM